MSKRYSVGIDLGTSNSVVAICDSQDDSITVIPITQALSADTVGEREIFPSALYFPHENEFPADSFRLPWNVDLEQEAVCGTFARERGALLPDRLVASAKSWLCNRHIDRTGPVLPWGSESVKKKISPFEASRIYLQHMRSAFEVNTGQIGKAISLAECEVVVTVPASFDAVARSLTYEAANAAGIDNLILIEEPQAAFYSWIAQTEGKWREQINAGDLVLVCDVGGGTADFSLIAVADVDGNLELHRISVGDHILLGGDNMDLALAFATRGKLEQEGHSLDHWQFLSLVHGCRVAKEKLFSNDEIETVPVAVPARGSSLFAQTLSTSLTRQEAMSVILDGFIPLTAVHEHPIEKMSAGLQEYGLNYASDPALSKHLALFLTRSAENVRSDERLKALLADRADIASSSFLMPDAILFNGGVFKASCLRERILELLASWNDGAAPRTLQGSHFDLAVGKGAAQYGSIRMKGEGLRIRAGTARSYYLGIESSMPAIPGYQAPLNGLCIVPQGMEEGTELCVENKEFGLVTGKPVEFRFFSSSVRAGDQIGLIVENAAGELAESSGLQITLPSIEGMEGETVPVKLHSAVNETGMLELWMHHTRSEQKWKLEFNVRAES